MLAGNDNGRAGSAKSQRVVRARARRVSRETARPPAYKPVPTPDQAQGRPSEPVRMVVRRQTAKRDATGRRQVRAHVVTVPDVEHARAALARRDAARQLRREARRDDRRSATPGVIVVPKPGQTYEDAQKQRPKYERQYHRRLAGAEDALSQRVHRKVAAMRRSDQRDIRELGAARRGQAGTRIAQASAAKIARGYDRELVTREPSAPERKALEITLAQAAHRRRGVKLPDEVRGLVKAEQDKRIARAKADKQRSRITPGNIARNAVAEVRDAVANAPSSVAEIVKTAGHAFGEQEQGLKNKPYTARLGKIAKAATIDSAPGKLLRGDLAGAAHAAAHNPVGTALTAFAGSGTLARAALATRAVRATRATRTVRAAIKADAGARRARPDLRVVARSGGEIARKARVYSNHPGVRAIQKSREQLKAARGSDPHAVRDRGRLSKGGRVTSKAARRAMAVRRGGARSQVADIERQVAQTQKAVKGHRDEATRHLVRNLSAAGVIDGTSAAAALHSARAVRRGLQRQHSLHMELAAATGRAPDVAGLERAMHHLDDAIAQGAHGPLGDAALHDAGRVHREISAGQESRRQKWSDLDPVEAERRLRLQAAVLRGQIAWDPQTRAFRRVHHEDVGQHANGDPIQSVSLGRQVSADDLPAVTGGYLRPPGDAKPREITAALARTGQDFTGQELLRHLDFNLGDAQLANERSLALNALRHRARDFAHEGGVITGAEAASSAAKRLRRKGEGRWAPLEVEKGAGGERRFVLVPKAVADSFEAHSRAGNLVNRTGHRATRAFVRAVLPLSASWHAGNAADLAVRLAVSGARPGDAALAHHLRRALADQRDEPWAREIIDSVSGAHAAHHLELDGASRRVPVLSEAIDRLFSATAGLERRGARTAQGLVARRLGAELGLSVADHVKLGQQLAHNLARDPALVERFMQETLDVIGDYLTNPSRIAGVDARVLVPFVQWLKAANKFVWSTLPARHPYKAALLLLAAQATEAQRRELGLSAYWSDAELAKMGLPKKRDQFNLGGIAMGIDPRFPGTGSLVPTSPFFSFGEAARLLDDPAVALSDSVLPWLNKPAGGALAGKASATKLGISKLRQALGLPDLGQDAGTPLSADAVRAFLQRGAESFITGAGALHRARLGGAMPIFGSTIVHPKGAGPRTNPLVAAFNVPRARAELPARKGPPTVVRVNRRGRGQILQERTERPAASPDGPGASEVIDQVTGRRTPGVHLKGKRIVKARRPQRPRPAIN